MGQVMVFDVLILILMEYPLTTTITSSVIFCGLVLILILMEYPLTRKLKRIIKQLVSLNPYSNGIPSDIYWHLRKIP